MLDDESLKLTLKYESEVSAQDDGKRSHSGFWIECHFPSGYQICTGVVPIEFESVVEPLAKMPALRLLEVLPQHPRDILGRQKAMPRSLPHHGPWKPDLITRPSR